MIIGLTLRKPTFIGHNPSILIFTSKYLVKKWFSLPIYQPANHLPSISHPFHHISPLNAAKRQVRHHVGIKFILLRYPRRGGGVAIGHGHCGHGYPWQNLWEANNQEFGWWLGGMFVSVSNSLNSLKWTTWLKKVAHIELTYADPVLSVLVHAVSVFVTTID